MVFLSVPLDVLKQRVVPATDRPLIHEEADLERLVLHRRDGTRNEIALAPK